MEWIQSLEPHIIDKYDEIFTNIQINLQGKLSSFFYIINILIGRVMKYIVVTISDTSSLDAKKDLSGPEIVKFMGKENILLGQEIVSDDIDKIISVLDKWLEVEDLNLILTTGGTGIGPRDVTPEATKKIIDYEIPGIPELMRVKNYLNSDYVSLSRSVAGVKSKKLIVNLPGSVKAVTENLQIVYPLLKHAIELINGNTKH